MLVSPESPSALKMASACCGSPRSKAPRTPSTSGLGAWMQALGTPLLVGLPTLGLVMAALGYATVQLLWLAPALQRKRRLARSR